MLRKPHRGMIDTQRDDMVMTFAGLTENTDFLKQIRTVMELLRGAMGTPVDLEFAHDGEHLYLLQCRPQVQMGDDGQVTVPTRIAFDHKLFSASRFVTNGHVDRIRYLVYVDPEEYRMLATRAELQAVAEVVNRLNALLPRRAFILMGPGRWGSRGDIRLGVPVSYADISNSALLVEIARQKGGYLPDLSFGTHFFQDLVEASIRYLPLYPDDPDVVFKEAFFLRTPNALADLLPEFAALSDVLRVIDVPRAAGGRVLRVLMNGDLDLAVGLLAAANSADQPATAAESASEPRSDEHWRWRLRMAQRIAAALDLSRFGVKAAYVFGSTKNGTAGPASDIDLLLHVEDADARRGELRAWLDGWSASLAEINYLRTGYRSDGLLDVHYVTDADIAHGTSYAAKIGAVTDAARPLPIGAAAGEQR
jgi:pyruvate,water dikinase